MEVLHADQVVARAVHFGEPQGLAAAPQVVDVHQFGVILVEAAGDDVCQSVGGVQRGEAGHILLQGVPVQVGVFRHGGVHHGAGIDDIAELTGLQQAQGLVALVQAVHIGDGDAQGGDDIGGVAGGVQPQAHVVQLFGQHHQVAGLPHIHADEHAHLAVPPGGLDPDARGGEALEQRLVHGLAQTQHLAGGLHLGPQVGIDVVELFKGKDRHLDGAVGRHGIQAGAVAQILQRSAQHHPAGQVYHGHAGDLADIGHRAGGTGIDLDNVQLVLIDQVLDIHQSAGAQAEGQFFGAVDDGAQHGVAEVVGGIDSDGVAGMNARPLDVLHDAGNEHIPAVGDNVHLQLGTLHILVHQHRVLDAAGKDDVHVLFHVGVLVGDGHVLAADDVGGAQQHGVAQLVGGLQRLRQGADAPAPGPADAELFQQGVKPLPVLGHVDAVGRGAQNGDALPVQELCQLDGGLSAEGHHHAHRLFHIDDVHHVLRAERLEIQAVSGVIVGGDRFGVIVDDGYGVAQFLQGPDTVDGGIVELDALADADGAGAQHQHRGLAFLGHKGPGLAFLAVGGVEIGGLRIEFAAAGIHHLINGFLRGTGQGGSAAEPQKGLVGIAQLLALSVGLGRKAVTGQPGFKIRQLFDLAQEPGVDAGDPVDVLQGDARFDGFKNVEQPVVVGHLEPLQHGNAAVVCPVEGVQLDLAAPDGLHQGVFKAGADGHDLAGGLHGGAQLPAGACELVKGPLGNLHYHIIHAGFKAGTGLARDVVFDLVQGIAQGDLGGHLGDGVAGGLGGQGRGTGDTGVDLNNSVFKAVGVQSELAVAAAHDAQGRHDVQGGGAQHLIFLVGKGQGRGRHDGIAGVYAHRVEVFHGAHGDDVAHAVPHGLELDLLPAEDVLFHQHLVDGAGLQAARSHGFQLAGVVGHAAAEAAQGKGGADDDGIADALCDGQGGLHIVGDVRGDRGLADGVHGLLE